ncbi:uncharacterized protein LOC122209434 isoform X2 [Panthera leo]|uniref:uncharacterized protein LOC122209434 isoform X2 n=1 Tax=Panthera leo TaxID=9689 RepID=UPI001C69ECB8|nr:uncharacterized protein LOC122209434 isoform X2 [Panthera leo]
MSPIPHRRKPRSFPRDIEPLGTPACVCCVATARSTGWVLKVLPELVSGDPWLLCRKTPASGAGTFQSILDPHPYTQKWTEACDPARCTRQSSSFLPCSGMIGEAGDISLQNFAHDHICPGILCIIISSSTPGRRHPHLLIQTLLRFGFLFSKTPVPSLQNYCVLLTFLSLWSLGGHKSSTANMFRSAG